MCDQSFLLHLSLLPAFQPKNALTQQACACVHMIAQCPPGGGGGGVQKISWICKGSPVGTAVVCMLQDSRDGLSRVDGVTQGDLEVSRKAVHQMGHVAQGHSNVPLVLGFLVPPKQPLQGLLYLAWIQLKAGNDQPSLLPALDKLHSHQAGMKSAKGGGFHSRMQLRSAVLKRSGTSAAPGNTRFTATSQIHRTHRKKDSPCFRVTQWCKKTSFWHGISSKVV